MTLFRRSDKIILTLTGDRAVWSRWRGNEQIAEFSELLPAGGCDDPGSEARKSASTTFGISSTSRCPWVLEHEVSSPPLQVHLVVDSANSEVLRVETASTLTGSGQSRIGGLIQERRLIDRLRQNHSDATVSRAKGTSALEAAWLSREQWPEQWMVWLQGLQSAGVLVTHVTTSLQLLTGQATEVSGDVLFVLVGGSRQQHTLVRGGVVVFRRVVAVDGEDSIRTALTDSLNHLQSRLSVTSVSLRYFGLSEALGNEWRAHAIVADVSWPGLTIDELASVTECSDVCERDDEIARMLACAAVRAPTFRGRTSAPASGPVADLLRARVARDRLSRLGMAAMLSVFIASVTVAVAAVEGFSSVHEDARLKQEQVRLSSRISELDQAALSLHPKADTAADLLLRMETFEQARQRSTPALMALLSDVLQDFPAIGLDTLQWQTDVADLNPNEAQPDTVEDFWVHRADLQTESSLVLEFSGKVDASLSLRERQERFDAFVETLTHLDSVARVEVLLSPLAQAAASSRGIISLDEPDYQVRVNLHAS